MRFLVLPIALAGCMTTAENFQAADNSNRQMDMDSCMAEATREVPQRMDFAGIDLNFDIRMRYFDRCMASRGYTKV